MKYYVIFEMQDGARKWEVHYKECRDKNDAFSFIEIHKKAFNIRNIIGPLLLIE